MPRLIALLAAVLMGLLLPRTALADEPPLVVLVPLGPVDADLLEEVARAITAKVAVRTRVDPVRELPKEAFYPPRKRYRAEKLLDVVDAELPTGAWKVVAVTQAEISTTKEDIEDWGIAGLGSIGGNTCVVSTFIYRKHSKSRAALRRRVGDLAVHEFGHTLGLDHCPSAGCVMRDAKGKALKSADSSSGLFCARCRKTLPVPVGDLLRTPSSARSH